TITDNSPMKRSVSSLGHGRLGRGPRADDYAMERVMPEEGPRHGHGAEIAVIELLRDHSAATLMLTQASPPHSRATCHPKIKSVNVAVLKSGVTTTTTTTITITAQWRRSATHLRERGDYGQRQRRWSRSPSEGRECLTHRQGSSSVSGSPVPSTSGTSTRQLPQTPATPRPHITYSPVIRKPVGTPPSGPQSRLPTPTQRRFSPPVPEPSVPPHHGSGRRARWCPGSSESAPGDNLYDYERCEPPAYEPNPGQGNPHPHNPAPHPRSPRTAHPAGARRMPNGYRSSSPSPQRPPHSAPHKPPHPRGPRKGLHEMEREGGRRKAEREAGERQRGGRTERGRREEEMEAGESMREAGERKRWRLERA
ncbi:voltage-dependent P/Q-type calcium channel subunit alpha-1A-like, partial [Silurus meridionalis]|uniref:voltage-dependent P/Q-type calcium channel subunit alpha-1A-like n=1 Tax=Silurus meridionalis TaxID=175797 RepID=UPI001EEC7024